MMRFIKQLELQGFKSFPGKTKILFHPGITIIVGPNGCGKSNIVDSVLWVLGEQKLKNLRGDRTEDIIFNGNSRRAPLGMADVIITIGNEDEEIIIEHRAFRNGESEYRLNGKRVRLMDIQDALWSYGIGEKEYFVISQGNVEQIVNAKSSERRLFLEEAAGIGKYRERKRQTQNKLLESEQNLIRLEDIIYEVERQKNSLKRQASAARRYRLLREKIRSLGLTYLRQKIGELKENRQEILEKYYRSYEKEKEILQKIKSEEIQLNKAGNKIWDLESKLKNFQEKKYSLKSQISKLITQKEKEERRKEFLQEKIKEIESNIEEQKTELLQIEERLKVNSTEKIEFIKVFEKSNREFKEIEEHFNLIKNKIDELQEKLNKNEKESFRIQERSTSIRNELLLSKKEKESLSVQRDKLFNTIKNEKNFLAKKQEELIKKREKLRKLKNSIEAIKKKEDNLKKELEEIEKLIDLKEGELNFLENGLQDLTNNLAVLERLKEKSLSSIEKRNYDGSLGILGENIEVEQEFLSSAEIFWKEELKSILIEREDFQKLLKKNTELKGAFLLSKEGAEDNIASEVLKNPSVVGLLKSKIKFKFPEFHSSLREAVIVKDIVSAFELWLKNPGINFVTLDGDVIFSNGLVKLSQKEEGLLTIQNQIQNILSKKEDLEKKIFSMKKALDLKNSEKSNILTKIELEKDKFNKLEREYLEESKEYEFLEQEVNKIKNRISVFDQELEFMKKEEENLTDKIKNLSTEEQEIKSNFSKVEKEKKLLLEEFNKIQEEKKEKSDSLIQVRSSIQLNQEKINNLEKIISSLNERKEKIEIKINEYNKEISNAKIEIDKISKFLEESFRELKKLENEETKLDEKIKDIEEKLIQFKSDSKKRESYLLDLRENYEKIKEERIKWEVQKAEIERDFLNLEEKCWQEFNKSAEEIEREVPFEKREDLEEIEKELEKAKNQLNRFKEVNMMAEEEYEAQKERYNFLIQQKNDLLESIDSTQKAIKKIDEESRELFLQAFEQVNKNFQNTFRLLFGGGKAQLKLTNKNNPLESGIEIVAQPPGKRLQNLMLFSGGEKTLISLAFLFSLFQYKPSPFCVLDEVDATLDEANLDRFSAFIKQLSENTQFLIVTHNLKTMEIADYIYGITMSEPNVSSLYSIKLQKK